MPAWWPGIEDCPDAPPCWISAGLIDLQVNGFGGIDLNDGSLTPGRVADLDRLLRGQGVTTWFPTLITASEASLTAALSAIAAARKADPRVGHSIAGGPCRGSVHRPGRRAAGRASRRPGPAAGSRRGGPLAGGLRRAGADGHPLAALAGDWGLRPGAVDTGNPRGARAYQCDAPDQIRAAADAGARFSTHLGNGASAMLPRHPNMIWSQLADDRLTASFIADGHHLPADTFKAMLRAKGLDRAMLVSDSTALGGMAPGLYDRADRWPGGTSHRRLARNARDAVSGRGRAAAEPRRGDRRGRGRPAAGRRAGAGDGQSGPAGGRSGRAPARGVRRSLHVRLDAWGSDAGGLGDLASRRNGMTVLRAGVAVADITPDPAMLAPGPASGGICRSHGTGDGRPRSADSAGGGGRGYRHRRRRHRRAARGDQRPHPRAVRPAGRSGDRHRHAYPWRAPWRCPDGWAGSLTLGSCKRSRMAASRPSMRLSPTDGPQRSPFGLGADPDVARNRRHADGPVDRDLPVLRIREADGGLRAVVLAYACHPVVCSVRTTGR